MFGNYAFPMGLNLGVGLNAQLRRTADAAGANPDYTNGGEIPDAPRGSGIQTVDGFKTRTPFQTTVDAQMSYVIKLRGSRNITLLADVFNLFNTQTVLMYDQWTQLTGPARTPTSARRSRRCLPVRRRSSRHLVRFVSAPACRSDTIVAPTPRRRATAVALRLGGRRNLSDNTGHSST